MKEKRVRRGRKLTPTATRERRTVWGLGSAINEICEMECYWKGQLGEERGVNQEEKKVRGLGAQNGYSHRRGHAEKIKKNRSFPTLNAGPVVKREEKGGSREEVGFEEC